MQNVDFIMGFSYIVFLDSVLPWPLAQFLLLVACLFPQDAFCSHVSYILLSLFYSFSILALCSFIAVLISIKLKPRLQYERKHVAFGFLGLGYFAWYSNFSFIYFLQMSWFQFSLWPSKIALSICTTFPYPFMYWRTSRLGSF